MIYSKLLNNKITINNFRRLNKKNIISNIGLLALLLFTTLLSIYISLGMMEVAALGLIFCAETGTCDLMSILYLLSLLPTIINVFVFIFLISFFGKDFKKWLKLAIISPAILVALGWNFQLFYSMYKDYAFQKELRESLTILDKSALLCSSENELISFNYLINLKGSGDFYFDGIEVNHGGVGAPDFKASDILFSIDDKAISIIEVENKSNFLIEYKTNQMHLTKGKHKLTISYNSTYEPLKNKLKSRFKSHKLIENMFRLLEPGNTDNIVIFDKKARTKCLEKRVLQYYSPKSNTLASELVSKFCPGTACGCILTHQNIKFFPNNLTVWNACRKQQFLYNALDYYSQNEAIENISEIKQSNSENFGVLLNFKNQEKKEDQIIQDRLFIITGNENENWVGHYSGVKENELLFAYQIPMDWFMNEPNTTVKILNENVVNIINSISNNINYPNYRLFTISTKQPLIENNKISEERLKDLLNNFNSLYAASDTTQEYNNDKVRIKLKERNRNMRVDISIIQLNVYNNTYVISVFKYYEDDINSILLAMKLHESFENLKRPSY